MIKFITVMKVPFGRIVKLVSPVQINENNEIANVGVEKTVHIKD